ncbi:MAG: aminotransferase class I/II-fold pyridoxal phosphate-dependent enzyme, partial [Rhodocyclales bacterium]|nr:aminotransferase class I/II-fold pyridoxal phosphate-dependent enzyme [Rhodocyclales bacterium]
NGSNDVLDLAARVFLAPGRSAVFSRHAFAVYPLATMSAGAECLAAPAKNYGHDPAAMLAAIRGDTHVVWIANPNNPTGNFLPQAEVRAFIENIPSHICVVLDEAYTEYLAPAERADTVAWVRDYPNLLVVRTFSKIYGLAGLRVGYAVGDATLIEALTRVKDSFNSYPLDRLALAGACAVIEDHEWFERNRQAVIRTRARLSGDLASIGFEVLPSAANFVFVRHPRCAAADVSRELRERSIIVRHFRLPRIEQFLRITIGTDEQCDLLLAALREILPE